MTAVPGVLDTPPWETAPPAEVPRVAGLEPPAERRITWAPGEREEWAAVPPHVTYQPGTLALALKRFAAGQIQDEHRKACLFAQGPLEEVRPYVIEWRPDAHWDLAGQLRPVIARFEVDALDAVFHAARGDRRGAGPELRPFLDAEVARLMAGWSYRVASARRITGPWFERHGVDAVPYLVPDALSGRAPARRSAEAALRLIAASSGPDAVTEAARFHGAEAAAAVAVLLADGAGPPLPPPPVPAWAEPRALPRVPLRGGGGDLPPKAARNFVLLLAMTKNPELYPGSEGWLGEVLEAVEPAAVADFGWALFQGWQEAGTPSRHNWALPVLGRIGDDETARRLTPWVKSCPGWKGYARAAVGVDTLAALGTDTALLGINGIARGARYKRLRERAHETLEEVAERRGLTAERLTDRLVPDFGLDADGTMTLDYGPRRFVVGFDERLKPRVHDEQGRPRKALPKPGVRDDEAVAAAARRRFDALKKDVRTVAADRVHRLESAMVTGVRWTPAEFRDHFAGHPLMWHIARRLVWLADGAEGGDGADVGDDTGGGVRTFRIAEDRTLAGIGEDAFTLAGTARVGVAHPLHLGDGLKEWSEVFADYELLQPFPQLGRRVHAFTAAELGGARLRRFEGVTVPIGKVLGLVRRGWDRGVPMDAGIERWISRRVGDGRYLQIELDPGIRVGDLTHALEQRFDRVGLRTAPGEGPEPGAGPALAGPVLADLDPVTASEVLAELTAITGDIA